MLLVPFPSRRPLPPPRPARLLRSATGMPSRAAVLPPHLAALRDRMRGSVVGRAGVLPFGDRRMDECLPADGARRGLPLGAVHEVGAAGIEAETGALGAGFIAGLLARLPSNLPVLWAAPRDDLYAPGLLAFGLDPGRLVMARPGDDAATLAVMETGLREGGLAAVVGEVGGFERIASRRLMLACQRHGVTGFVLRRWPHGRRGRDEATAVATRWEIAAVPSDDDGREPGPPRWRAMLTHCRGGKPGAWIVEAGESEDGAAHPVRVVAALAVDEAAAAQRRRRA